MPDYAPDYWHHWLGYEIKNVLRVYFRQANHELFAPLVNTISIDITIRARHK